MDFVCIIVQDKMACAEMEVEVLEVVEKKKMHNDSQEHVENNLVILKI